jgi:hypothetical protein
MTTEHRLPQSGSINQKGGYKYTQSGLNKCHIFLDNYRGGCLGTCHYLDYQNRRADYVIEAITEEDLQRIQQTLRRRLIGLFKRRGLLEPEQAQDLLSWVSRYK